MPTCYGYMRASTQGQQYTYEVQRNAILAYFENSLKPKGFVMGEIFEDKATSGTTEFTERVGGRAAFACTVNGDAIVWSKLDRAFRNIKDGAKTIGMLNDKGVSIHSLDIALDTSTALGGFVLHLLVLLASLERSWISQRTKEALAVRKGKPCFHRPPTGWMQGTTAIGKNSRGYPIYDWVHNDLERKVLDWVMQQRLLRHWHMKRCVAELARVKAKRTNGKPYTIDWLYCGLAARKAGYPGRDGFREEWMAANRDRALAQSVVLACQDGT